MLKGFPAKLLDFMKVCYLTLIDQLLVSERVSIFRKKVLMLYFDKMLCGKRPALLSSSYFLKVTFYLNLFQQNFAFPNCSIDSLRFFDVKYIEKWIQFMSGSADDLGLNIFDGFLGEVRLERLQEGRGWRERRVVEWRMVGNQKIKWVGLQLGRVMKQCKWEQQGVDKRENFDFRYNQIKVQMMENKPMREVRPSRMFTYQEKAPSSLNQYYKNILINVVHASYKSETHLQIIRKPLKLEPATHPPPKQDNPYVFRPKSYSTKRNQHQHTPPAQLPRTTPSKRVKRQISSKKDSSPTYSYDLSKVLNDTKKKASEFLNHQFRPCLKKDQQIFKYSFCAENETANKKQNPMLENQIDIISNQNEKISVCIHDGLLKSNTNHEKLEKDEHFLSKVVNPYSYQRKNHFLHSIPFIKDYKSGYAPIDMQLNNSDQAEQTYIGSIKPHFIRKKQSTLSLPRSCGVSYIKESESIQGKPYEPLPPLIFQCSSNCRDVKSKHEEEVKKFIQVCQNSWISFIRTEENHMRDLLLGKRVGEVGWVKGVQNLWPLFAESLFLLLIFSEQQPASQSQVWNCYSKTVFKIGILTKKSTSGKKSFFKSIGIDDSKILSLKEKKTSMTEQKIQTPESAKRFEQKKQQAEKEEKQLSNTPESEEKKESNTVEDIVHELKDCKNLTTLSLRTEMYVEEQQWKSSSLDEKDLLCCLITSLKEHLEKQSLDIIKTRLCLAKSVNKEESLNSMIINLRKPSQPKVESQMLEQLRKSDQKITPSLVKSMINALDNQQQPIHTKNFDFGDVSRINKNDALWEKVLKMPLYYISTRDSFAFDLVEKVTYLQRNGHQYKKIDYYFEPDNLPSNYGNDYRSRFPNFEVGVTCYHDFFSDEELKHFEAKTFETEENAFKSKFLQMTVQPSIVGSKIKRTKFFFNYRYMWTRCQLAEPGSYIGAGVRKDVTPPPKWTEKIQNDFVQHSIVEKDFLNSIAINVYHDGKEGLAQHFDDAVRFRQPIYTLRLFSDARLSFGSQFYGFCNGAFIIPLPRGCICVLGENSYAANGVKHCVRPCDMTGKSAAVILRQMHSQVVNEASKYDELIDFPAWISCLSEKDDSVTFAEQKRREAEYILSLPK